MVRDAIERMSGYTPGEQPRGRAFVKLNTNENPYPPSPKAVAAIAAAAEAGLQRYPDPAATPFRERAAEALASQCVDITPDWLLCGNGSDDVLTIATRAFVGEGQAVRYATPSYSLYQTLAEIQGARTDVVPYEADWSLGFGFTAAGDDVRLAFLANPNGPSGTQLAPGEVAAIADALPCPLLVDEAYVDFAEAHCLDLVRTNERVMVSRTLSKSYGLAGLRFGFLVAQPHVVAQLQKVKDSYNCDALAIAGAAAAIEDQAWLAANVARVVAERARLDALLRERGFTTVPSQANFVWATRPEVAAKPDVHASIFEGLRSAGVLVRYMAYPNWPGGYDGLRVTVGTPEQTDALATALDGVLNPR